ncbi:MBL fold metallo-hydrolase [Ilumatobacter sp.]|uniref:MBL fold metallo-hydrolase n=1 Tax=Ilumatobacter sp. TaxID=1967498 RepID=UPI003B51918A
MGAQTVDWGDDERRLSASVSVLGGAERGGYPSGNTLLVRGSAETVVIDPSIDVVARGGVPAPVDAVINSHSHEDHVAGNSLFGDARVHVHHEDLPGVTSLDGLMEVYGLTGEARSDFEQTVVEEFHYAPRPDATGFSDGHVFDLGGARIEAVHLPGHTRGHSGFRIGEVFFLSDIDLTGFGPYYGDVWSDLDDFEDSLVRVRDEDAEHYVTFHHKGVIDGRERFVELLDAFHSVIGRRHGEMLDFLAEPRTIDEMVEHRFIYRPHVEMAFVDSVERRSAEMHVARMIRRGEAAEVDPGRYRAG